MVWMVNESHIFQVWQAIRGRKLSLWNGENECQWFMYNVFLWKVPQSCKFMTFDVVKSCLASIIFFLNVNIRAKKEKEYLRFVLGSTDLQSQLGLMLTVQSNRVEILQGNYRRCYGHLVLPLSDVTVPKSKFCYIYVVMKA